jgi:hypothetical protein
MTHESKPTTPSDIDYDNNENAASETAQKIITTLREATADAWEIENIHTKDEELTQDDPIVSGLLQHAQSGSMIQIIPIDTDRTDDNTPEYNTHRIRIQNRKNESTEYALARVSDKHKSIDGLTEEDLNPISANVGTVSQETLHNSDNKNIAFTNNTLTMVIIAVVVSAKRISKQDQYQSKLVGF